MNAKEAGLLGGKLAFRQPDEGYRAAIDPIFLAAACPAGAGDRVADLGAGAGAASLSLAWRCPENSLVSVERDGHVAAFLKQNITANGFDKRVMAVDGDIRTLSTTDIGGAVQAVLLNPPYLLEGAYTRSDSPARASANSEGDTPLADWIAAARRLSAPKASITLIHRADRLSDLLAELSPAYGGVRIIPLWPRKGVAAKRIIITGQLGSRAPLSLTAGVVVHQSDGSFTPEAQMVLRDGGPLTV